MNLSVIGTVRNPDYLYVPVLCQERDDYAALVEALGGETMDSQHFNCRCTHLVAGNIASSDLKLDILLLLCVTASPSLVDRKAGVTQLSLITELSVK